jgi:hypothetical protein
MPHANEPLDVDSPAGAVTGPPRLWLRLEAIAATAVAAAAYGIGGHSWVVFAALFFVPDLTFAAYLAGPRVGAACYNVAHSYAVPVAVGAALHALGRPIGIPLIWIAHIGFDRTLGYGLKYAGGFAVTHLGRLGGGRPAVGQVR